MNTVFPSQENEREPVVTPELVDYFDEVFSLSSFMSTTEVAKLHRIQGWRDVIDHMKAMYARQNPEGD